MGHFKWALRVQLLIHAVLVASTPETEVPMKGTNLISEILHIFMKPVLRSVNVESSIQTNTHRDFEDHAPQINQTHTHAYNKIAKTIRKKLAELQPLLQDDDVNSETEDNLTLRGNKETTIVEFLPNASRKNNDGTEHIQKILKPELFHKYKQLKELINAIFDEEDVPKAKKTLITNTLDEIISQLIESHCSWTSENQIPKEHNHTKSSISKLRGMTKKEWKRMREQYLDYLNKKQEIENTFIKQFHQFFSSVINDTYNLPDTYKIKCQLVKINKNKDNKDAKALRQNKGKHKKQCKHFKVCSYELKEFLADFYIYVNDTAVSTFKNYGAMYVRDVTLDLGLDKNIVVSILNNLANAAERKVSKIYKNEVKHFQLDPNKNKYENINHISNFIKSTVAQIKTVVKANLVRELGAMKTKLFTTIKEDVDVNFQLDMENLEKHYIDTLCTMFVLCNGISYARRNEEPWTFVPRANNEMFVNVQLSLNDEMRTAIRKSELLDRLPHRVHYKINLGKPIYDLGKSSENNKIHVTRTTTRKTSATVKQRSLVSKPKDSPTTPKDSLTSVKVIFFKSTNKRITLLEESTSIENEIY